MEIRIQSPLYGGMALAKEDVIYFVKGAIPGETVEIRITEKKKDYTLAETVGVLEHSPFREDPPCPVFGICGGCHYQFMNYERQVGIKQEIICDCFRRIGKIQELPFEEALAGRPAGYRRRAQFKISGGRIGFYRENSHDIVEFDRCMLLSEGLNEAYLKLKRLSWPDEIREITLTHGDSVIAAIPKAEIRNPFLNELMNEKIFAGITVADGSLPGEPCTEFDLNGLRYTVSANGFLQANWDLNLRLSDLITETIRNKTATPGPVESEGKPPAKGSLLDIYGGAGNFSLPLSDLFDRIVIVEENGSSVRDGIRNAEINGLENVSFLQSTSEDFKIKGRFDTVIVDPPRIGLTDRFIRKLMQLAPSSFLYISCNPATLARDAGKLKEMYKLESIRLVDMFPQTYHCEIFSLFTLK